MKFFFEGVEYRIGFFHDKPVDRSLEAHLLHDVAIVRIGMEQAELRCLTCDLKLQPLRPGETWRQTHCVIYCVHQGETITQDVLYSGTGRLNRKAGDQFDKAAGRCAALTAALKGSTNREFRKTAWKAYLNRKPKPRDAVADLLAGNDEAAWADIRKSHQASREAAEGSSEREPAPQVGQPKES